MNLSNEIIVAIAAFFGAALGGLFSFISSMLDRKMREKELNYEKLKKSAGRICDQYVSFYRLEQLYLQEIQELRGQLGKESKRDGIQDEFRKKVYDAQSVKIEYSENGILAEKDWMMNL